MALTPVPNGPFFVSHTLMQYNVAEFQVVMGTGRPQVGQPNGVHWPMGHQIDWSGCLSMSPQTAKHFHRQLTDAIDSYEARFGKIHEDPVVAPAENHGNVVGIGRSTPPPGVEEPYRWRPPEPASDGEPPQPPSPAA